MRPSFLGGESSWALLTLPRTTQRGRYISKKAANLDCPPPFSLFPGPPKNHTIPSNPWREGGLCRALLLFHRAVIAKGRPYKPASSSSFARTGVGSLRTVSAKGAPPSPALNVRCRKEGEGRKGCPAWWRERWRQSSFAQADLLLAPSLRFSFLALPSSSLSLSLLLRSSQKSEP